MNKPASSIEAGRQDAERLIKDEQIDFDPFIAISDIYLVRKTVPVSFAALEKTLEESDPELLEAVKSCTARREQEMGAAFSYDEYAEGMVEGVAAVWEKIRDQVL